ncbi:hypothetical protein [Streptomyces hypolithicus]
MHDTTCRVSPTTPAPAPAPSAETPQVLVETLLLRHDPVEGFAYRRLLAPLGHRARPDAAARRLALLEERDDGDDGDDGHIVHSTSWRATAEGQIILTYVVHPDPDPGRASRAVPDPLDVARAERPGYPEPRDLTVDQVAAHAIRHLAFLGRTDPAIAARLASRPHTRRALESIPGLTAGQL